VDTGIQYVGLTKDGNMDTPKSAVDVAWYKLGPAPGSPGSAVIAGHINTRYSAHGVFEHLDDLNAGDTVQVVAAGGKILNFKVTGKEYLGDADPAISVFARTDGTRLNLVTCAGTWNAERKSFDKRLVVYTELE
jgi:LPXTG-site transpeptidase (sortase) family protein